MRDERQTLQVQFPRRDRSFVPRLRFMKPKLLLVDDDPTVREMIGRVLTEAGHLVLLAANGQEALDLAAATEVDLVLLDLNMPVKGGWDTFERLTAENPFLPIIIITARPNQIFPALASGAGALMEKPLDFSKLLETIRALLSEPAEKRLTRMAGKPAEFRYVPPEHHPGSVNENVNPNGNANGS
jgi:DNA-binding response OmpR family regulator